MMSLRHARLGLAVRVRDGRGVWWREMDTGEGRRGGSTVRGGLLPALSEQILGGGGEGSGVAHLVAHHLQVRQVRLRQVVQRLLVTRHQLCRRRRLCLRLRRNLLLYRECVLPTPRVARRLNPVHVGLLPAVRVHAAVAKEG